MALGCIFSPDFAPAAGKKIAIMWVGESLPARTNLRGFLPRLKEIAPDVEVTVKMDIPDNRTAEKIFRDFEGSVDGIVFLRTNGAQFLATASPKKPCFVGATNNPEFLGTIKNLNAPEGNITGVTYYIPYDLRFGAIKQLFPTVKNVCLLLEKDHPSISIERKGTAEQCEKTGLAYSELVVESQDELVREAKEKIGKVDLFIIPNHHLIEKSTPAILKVTQPAKVPVFSYADSPIEMGALAGIGAREELLGRMLADSVVDIVVNGKPVSQVPVKTDPAPQITLNEAAMETFNLKLSPTLMTKARIIKKH
jgi:putative ABC transport system substrate-binding protein